MRLCHLPWDPQRGGELPRCWGGWRGQALGLGTAGGGGPVCPTAPEHRCGWVPPSSTALAGDPRRGWQPGRCPTSAWAGAVSPPCWDRRRGWGWGPLSPQAGEPPAAVPWWGERLDWSRQGGQLVRWVGWDWVSSWVPWVGAASAGCSGLRVPQPGPWLCLPKVSITAQEITPKKSFRAVIEEVFCSELSQQSLGWAEGLTHPHWGARLCPADPGRGDGAAGSWHLCTPSRGR